MKLRFIWIKIAVIIMIFSSFGWCKSDVLSAREGKSQKTKYKVAQKTEVPKNIRITGSVFAQLEQNVDVSDLRADMSFVQAIEVLRNSTKPPVKIIVLWKQLEQIGVEQTSIINVDGISDVPLRSVLKILLSSISDWQGDLDYWISGGVIVIGTKDSKPKDKVIRLHNVCDLTSAPAQYYAPGAGFGGNQWQGGQMGSGPYNQQFGQGGLGGNYGYNRAGGLYGGGGGRYGGGGGRYGGGGGRYGSWGGTSRSYGMQPGRLGMGSSLGFGTGYGQGYMGGGYPGAGGNWGGGMGMMGMGMGGGMGFGADAQFRQQQLAELIKNTVEPGTWQEE